jgi:hypothetical protein
VGSLKETPGKRPASFYLMAEERAAITFVHHCTGPTKEVNRVKPK